MYSGNSIAVQDALSSGLTEVTTRAVQEALAKDPNKSAPIPVRSLSMWILASR